MPDDDLTAQLEQIRERNASPGDAAGFVRSARDVPPLLAAVEAVLKLHVPIWNGGWQECVTCGPNNDNLVLYAAPGEGESFWPCSTWLAITTSLVPVKSSTEGEEGSNAPETPAPDTEEG